MVASDYLRVHLVHSLCPLTLLQRCYDRHECIYRLALHSRFCMSGNILACITWCHVTYTKVIYLSIPIRDWFNLSVNACLEKCNLPC